MQITNVNFALGGMNVQTWDPPPPPAQIYLWTWGNGLYGRLGDGTTIDRSSPVQIGALTSWLKVSAGNYNTAAIKTDGTLWSWGYNSKGTVGNGTSGGVGSGQSKSSPVQIGSLTNWLNIASGRYIVAAIKTDGTLWTWGQNNKGQLGLGDTTDRSSPVQVGASTAWLSVASGAEHFLAIG